MRVVFISGSGDSIAVAERLRREGVLDVGIYIHSPRHRANFDGIFPKINPGDLKRAVYRADKIIFDMTRTNGWAEYLEKKKKDPSAAPGKSAIADLKLIKTFGLNPKSPSLFGQLSAQLSKKIEIIGCSEWAEDVEMDRTLGVKIAKEIGLDIPEFHDFTSLHDGIDFLKDNSDRRWVLKPHDNQDNDLTYVEKYKGELLAKFQTQIVNRVGEKFDYMLQEAIEGHEISNERWWTGDRWIHLDRTIENKRTMNNNLGPAIGCQDSIVFACDEPINKKTLLFRQFEAYTPWVKKSGFIGPVDFNVIVTKDGKVYFLEFTHRFGYDALFCLMALMVGDLTSFFTKGFQATWFDGFTGSQRITIPPFPEEDNEALKKKALGVPISGKIDKMPWFWAGDVKMMNNHLVCAGADGILGVVTGRGETLGKCVEDVYENIHKLKVGAYMQYRTDLHVRAQKLLNAFKTWGVEVG